MLERTLLHINFATKQFDPIQQVMWHPLKKGVETFIETCLLHKKDLAACYNRIRTSRKILKKIYPFPTSIYPLYFHLQFLQPEIDKNLEKSRQLLDALSSALSSFPKSGSPQTVTKVSIQEKQSLRPLRKRLSQEKQEKIHILFQKKVPVSDIAQSLSFYCLYLD